MNVTLTIGNRDFSSRLSSYAVNKEISYSNVITTIDGSEYIGRRFEKYIILFSLFPSSDNTTKLDYNALMNDVFEVTFTDPYTESSVTKRMRVNSNIEKTFALSSITGERYYLGGEIELRETAS